MWRRVILAAGLTLLLLVAREAAARHAEPRAEVGSAGVGAGTYPVVEVAGLGSNGGGFAGLTARLRQDGVPVLDFDPDQAGIQPLVYTRDMRVSSIEELATDVVEPAIASALERAGYDADQVVDVVSHSTGGLAARYLVEKRPGWADRVDDLVMVAVPNHGSRLIYLETRGGGPFSGLGADMRPGSGFLDSLGYAEPQGEVYTTFGGDPWLLRTTFPWWGIGFDDQVPSTSPFLDGAANNVYPSFHGRLLRSGDVIDKIVRTLRAS